MIYAIYKTEINLFNINDSNWKYLNTTISEQGRFCELSKKYFTNICESNDFFLFSFCRVYLKISEFFLNGVKDKTSLSPRQIILSWYKYLKKEENKILNFLLLKIWHIYFKVNEIHVQVKESINLWSINIIQLSNRLNIKYLVFFHMDFWKASR